MENRHRVGSVRLQLYVSCVINIRYMGYFSILLIDVDKCYHGVTRDVYSNLLDIINQVTTGRHVVTGVCSHQGVTAQ